MEVGGEKKRNVLEEEGGGVVASAANHFSEPHYDEILGLIRRIPTLTTKDAISNFDAEVDL